MIKALLFTLIAATCLAQPQLPQSVMETRISFTPSSSYPTYVGPASPAPSLPMVLHAALPGAMVVVDPGSQTDLTGVLELPSGDCSDPLNQKWITVKTTSALIPDEYTRINPVFAVDMPKIVLQSPTARISKGICLRMIGLEVTRKVGGGAFYNFFSDLGHDVILDRMYIHGTPTDESVHGTPTDESVHGITLSNAYNVAVINSYLSDFHCMSPGTCSDAQAITGGTSSKPDGKYKIDNNYLEASGENILFGGGTANGPPCDVLITRNTLTKPMSWNPSDPSYAPVLGPDGKPHPWLVKNLLELKNICRVLIENNILSNVWGGFSQVGAMILVTPKNQSGANGTNICPLCAVTDVTIRNNHGSYGGQALQLACIPSPNGGWPAACHDWLITLNTFDHLQYKDCYQCTSFLNQLSNGNGGIPLSKVSVTKNTFELDVPGQFLPATAANAALSLGAPPAGIQEIHWDNNVFPSGNNGIYSTGGGAAANCFSNGWSIKPLIGTCWPGGSMTGNTITSPTNFDKRRLPWPDGNTVTVQ